MVCVSKCSLALFASRLQLIITSPTAAWENIFLLVLTAGLKIVLTAWTFGMQVISLHLFNARPSVIFFIDTSRYFLADHSHRRMSRPRNGSPHVSP